MLVVAAVVVVVVVVVAVGSRYWLLVQQSTMSPVGSAKPILQINNLNSSLRYPHLLRNCLRSTADPSQLQQSGRRL